MYKHRYQVDIVFALARTVLESARRSFRASALVLLTSAFVGSNATAQNLWTTDFADDQGWGHPEYATTMMFADLNKDGRRDVCGRGVAGIYCALSNGSGFNSAVFALADFTDAQGWNNPVYYSSLKLADVNGDGYADVCGRGIYGVFCALGTGDGYFHPSQLWSGQYADAGGWGFSQYGGTMMLGDLNHDGRADICVRGGAGIYCSLSTGSSFGPLILGEHYFSDTNGWSDSRYYNSLRLADVNGDGRLDVCGRASDGIHCALGKGDGTFAPATLWTVDFRDSLGWDQAQYGSTIMFADINGDGVSDVCGRGIACVYCATSNRHSFNAATLATTGYSDATGWNHSIYYGSMRLADVNGDHQADVCARGIYGIACALATTTFQ